MMTSLSSRSTGTPCGLLMSVPRISQMPRLVAKITMGARLDSRALPAERDKRGRDCHRGNGVDLVHLVDLVGRDKECARGASAARWAVLQPGAHCPNGW